MKKVLLAFAALFILAIGLTQTSLFKTTITSGAPPYLVTDDNPTDDALSWLQDWVRPKGPARVGLQVGHWKNDEVPEELERLRGNTGATGGGKSEWEVNYAIAMATKELLEEKGVTVDILPATIPPKYWADVFVAIHADGHTDASKTGFKAAAPRRDMTGKANELVEAIHTEYEAATGLTWDEETITRNMRGYYAFGWWRFEHAVHPMATAAILETGFLTTPADRKIIVNKPELAAKGLANGIVAYLESENLLTTP